MKKKVDKSIVTVYYRLVKTSPLMASVVVTPTMKEPSQTLAAAEEQFAKQDREIIRIIASDFHVSKEPPLPTEEKPKLSVVEKEATPEENHLTS